MLLGVKSHFWSERTVFWSEWAIRSFKMFVYNVQNSIKNLLKFLH